MNLKYGWRKQKPDFRDHEFHQYYLSKQSLPTHVDLRANCPDVYDQGDLGSCTANSLAGMIEFLLKKEKKEAFTPSRLFIYYNERLLEHTVNQDSGADLRDGMKVLAKQGSPHESLWWYDVSKFKEKPNKAVYDDGLKHLISNYMALTSVSQIKQCLADGYPAVFGFTVYSSFESKEVAKTGIVPMPSRREQDVGGHAVMLVGYDDHRQVYIVRNSWSAAWGDHGYCYMPYAYVNNSNLAGDFWTTRFVV